MSINNPNLVHTSESSWASTNNSFPSSGNEDQYYGVQEDKDKSIQGSKALMMGADQTSPMKSVEEENDSQEGDNEEKYLNPDIEDNERRLAQNRKTAQLRRDRNKGYLESLQMQKNRLSHKHQVLKSENELLKKQHTKLLSFMAQCKVQEQEQKQKQQPHHPLQPNRKHQQQQVLQHLVPYQQHLLKQLNGGNTSAFSQTSDSTPLTLNDQQYQQQYKKRTLNLPNNSTNTTALLQQQPQQPLLILQAYQQYQKQLLNNKNDKNNLAACSQQSATIPSASNNQQYHQPCKKRELKVPSCDTNTTSQLVQQGQEAQHVQQHGQHHQHQPLLNIQSYQNHLRQLLNNNNISTSCPQQIASMPRIASNDQRHQQDSKKRSLNDLDDNKKIQQFQQGQESITLSAKREIQGRPGECVASTNNITTASGATNQYPRSTVPSNQSQHPLQHLQHPALLFNNQQQNRGLQSYISNLLSLSSSHSGHGARNQQDPNQNYNNSHNN